MKDVEKTNVERQNSRKRIRRRKRMMNVYGLVVALLVITAGVAISYTFLFNIDEIRVSGESDMYTAEEIVLASGIHEGDNLLRLDPKKSEQRILDELLYVETATVKRDFPSSLEIKVTRCIPAFNVNYDQGTLLVSKNGKILSDNGFITEGLPVIYGYEPSVTTAGVMISSENEHKNEAFTELIASINASEEKNIATVDMSDELAILVNYSNGMVFKMGNWSDVEYKLKLAETVMNYDTVKGKKGYITMIGTNQCGFRTSDEPAEIPGVTEPTRPSATDADGNPVGGDVQVELNPEHEAIFDEFNNRNEGQQTDDTVGNDSYNNGNGYDDSNGYGGYDDGNNYGGYDDENNYDAYGNYIG